MIAIDAMLKIKILKDNAASALSFSVFMQKLKTNLILDVSRGLTERATAGREEGTGTGGH